MTMLAAPRRTLLDTPRDGQGNGVVLQGITWKAYKTLCDGVTDERVRMTYDRGKLEIMVVSTEHERLKTLLHLLITALAAGLRKLIGGFGSFTHQREDLARALEPDLCFYLRNLKKVRGKKLIDLMVDPPPDLAVEIEISRRVLDRLGLLAALGIPEVWRFDGKAIKVLVLQGNVYEESPTSLAFPGIDVKKLVPFLMIADSADDNAMMDKVRAWASKFRKARKKRKS